jgi:hypothetical protein
MEAQVKKAQLSPVISFLMSLLLVVGILVADLTNYHILPAAQAQTVVLKVVPVTAPNATLSSEVIAARGVTINGVASDAVFVGSVRIGNSFVDPNCGVTKLGVNAAGDTVYVLGAYPSGTPTDGSTGPNGAYPSGNPTDGSTGPNGAYPSGNPTDVGTALDGAYPSGTPTDGSAGPNGAYPSGNPTDVGTALLDGAYPSGNPTDGSTGPNGAYPSGIIYVGNNLQITGGVLTGDNISVTNGVVSGSNLVVVGAFVTGGGAH